MAHVALDAYLFFKDGKCEEAMDFYKGIFGGDVTIQKFDDMPGMKPENSDGKVMHATLKGGMITFMASDSTTDNPFGLSPISLSLSGEHDTEKDLREVFDKLAEGGKVTMPISTMPWKADFGTVTDKYGIEWMVNIAHEEA